MNCSLLLNKSSDIHVYDVQSLTYRRRIPVPRLLDPCDIAYSKQVLFVSETEEHLVHIIELQSVKITEMKIPGRTLKLSVNQSGDVMVSSFDPPNITILTPENYNSLLSSRAPHKSYGIDKYGSCLHHVIDLDGIFWAAACVKNPTNVTTNYVGKKNIPALYRIQYFSNYTYISKHDHRELDLMLDAPCYLELYDRINMHVSAADRNNNRIVKIDFNTMKIVDVVLPAWTGLVRPFTFCLNNRHDNIYVVDNRNQILMFDLDCKLRITSADNDNIGKLFWS